MKTLYIYGCGGHARSVCGIIIANGDDKEIMLVDDNAKKNETVLHFRTCNKIPDNNNYSFYAIGNNVEREKFFKMDNKELLTIVSATSCIGVDAKIGRGTFVGNFVNIGVQSYIGDNCIINTSAVIEHECRVDSHTHIAPRACVCGRSSIGERVFIGAGAIIINNIDICSDVIVGAGAVVIKNITEPGVYIGNPARRIK